MKYRVVYDRAAEQELAEVWLQSANRNGVTSASAWLDVKLQFRPLTIGRSRISTLQRISILPDLGSFYSVIPDDAKVIVQGVFAVE